MKIRALIVDDEPAARRSIWRFLKSNSDVEVVAEAGDGEAAVATVNSQKPDLVFLDVQMPEMDGFEVVRRIGPDKMPAIIFVTAHDRYALRAFETHAIDYLLKPFGRERFEIALMHARERIAGKAGSQEARRLLDALDQVKPRNDYAERLAVTENGRIVLVKTKDIDWIEAQGNYVRLHLREGAHELRETLAALEHKLNPQDFLRIHRSTIVNIHRIKEIRTWFHGYHLILLESGQKLRMSRYQHTVAQRLGLS